MQLQGAFEEFDQSIIEINTIDKKVLWLNKEAKKLFDNELCCDSLFNIISQDDWNAITIKHINLVRIKHRFYKINFFEVDKQTKNQFLMLDDVTEVYKENNEKSIQLTKLLEESMDENKKITIKLHNTQKLAAMGEMISNIAHHWRQPLSAISTAATGMQLQKACDLLEDDLFENFCDIINKNAQYLSNTIGDFTRLVQYEVKDISFKLRTNPQMFLNLINESLENYLIKIVLDLQEDESVVGYPAELIQCFMNLFNNSKDAFVRNKIDMRYIFITQKITDDHIIINFKDNAGGIDSQIISRIFEPYFTTKHKSKGTGLGLSVVYGLVENTMKGTVNVRNEVYEIDGNSYTGASFTMVIPINKGEE